MTSYQLPPTTYHRRDLSSGFDNLDSEIVGLGAEKEAVCQPV